MNQFWNEEIKPILTVFCWYGAGITALVGIGFIIEAAINNGWV